MSNTQANKIYHTKPSQGNKLFSRVGFLWIPNYNCKNTLKPCSQAILVTFVHTSLYLLTPFTKRHIQMTSFGKKLRFDWLGEGWLKTQRIP